VFTVSWLGGTTSLVDNAPLIKRVSVPRELVPISSVLSNCMHMSAQLALLLILAACTAGGVNRYWWWLLVLWPLEILFATGLSLAFSGLNVCIRDIRYVVESTNVVLFWLVPVFYPFSRSRPTIAICINSTPSPPWFWRPGTFVGRYRSASFADDQAGPEFHTHVPRRAAGFPPAPAKIL